MASSNLKIWRIKSQWMSVHVVARSFPAALDKWDRYCKKVLKKEGKDTVRGTLEIEEIELIQTLEVIV